MRLNSQVSQPAHSTWCADEWNGLLLGIKVEIGRRQAVEGFFVSL